MHKLPHSLLAILLVLLPLAVDAACFINCVCRERNGYGNTSRSYGPFNSTAACNVAVSSFTMQCQSGNMAHMFTATCMPGCFNCEPPAPPKAKVPLSGASAPDSQQSAWEKSVKEQEEAAQRQLQKDLESLKGGLKGVEVGNPNEIRLKAPPSGSALRQLDCAREQSMAGGIETHGKDWTHSSDCKPLRPEVPSVSTPVPAEMKGKIPQVQLDLQQRISVKRQELVRQDNEIVRLERAVRTEELKPEELKKEAAQGESVALKKARDALAKAQADRARTASEIAKLEKQEAAGSEAKH